MCNDYQNQLILAVILAEELEIKINKPCCQKNVD